MNKAYLLLAAAGLSLAACGGKGDDTTGDIVANDAGQAADALENRADAVSDAGNQAAADQLNANADAVRDAGNKAEDAIDDSDVSTDNPAAAAAHIEQQTGLPTSADTASKAANPGH
jgi:hypothetical protein